MKLLKTLFARISKLWINHLTHKNGDGVEYIWFRRRSDALVIVFSGIGNARFNYIRTLKHFRYDQLYIRDCWADGVSYYWFEKKRDYPEVFTTNLINEIILKGKYKEIITAGSSKGGTAALYYGLKINANLVLAGACQYKVGDYLSRHQYREHPEQWKAVVGDDRSEEWVNILDNKLPDMITRRKGCATRIMLVYSTEEHTWLEHVKPLIEYLDENHIEHLDQIEKFPDHSMIGEYFKKALVKFFMTHPFGR